MNCLLCILVSNGAISPHHCLCVGCINEMVNNDTSRQLTFLTKQINDFTGKKPSPKQMTSTMDEGDTAAAKRI